MQKLNELKRIAIISLFADDELANRFVLKGGTALDLIYKMNSRASIDIDISMNNDFTESELDDITSRMKESFCQTYEEYGYHIIDFKMHSRPRHQDPSRNKYWCGYSVEFKIISNEIYSEYGTNSDRQQLSRRAEVINNNNGKIFKIDISSYEFCDGKTSSDVDGYTVYVYTPEMIVYEKIRAICQKFPEYVINNGQFKTARPRDIYDIYTIMTDHNSDLSFEKLDYCTLKAFFDQKNVTMDLLDKIPKYYNKFTEALPSLTDTLTEEAQKDFDFQKCFDFVLDGIKKIQGK